MINYIAITFAMVVITLTQSVGLYSIIICSALHSAPHIACIIIVCVNVLTPWLEGAIVTTRNNERCYKISPLRIIPLSTFYQSSSLPKQRNDSWPRHQLSIRASIALLFCGQYLMDETEFKFDSSERNTYVSLFK